jgi:hypothetical protein
MSSTAKFVFDNDFSRSRQAKLGEADLAQASQSGFERGVAEGRAAAQGEIAAAYASRAAPTPSRRPRSMWR